MARYFYAVGDAKSGPFDLTEMLALVDRGIIPTTAVARREGDENWTLLSAFPEFARPAHSVSNAHAPGVVRVQRSRGIYLLLGLLFLGMVGGHNFYAGRYKQAVAQLLITILTGWLVLPLIAVAIWVIVECVTVTTDGNGIPLA